jgi:hypothetical protein
MTGPSQISIAAFVADGERPAVELAAIHIARALSQAAGTPWTCDVSYASDKGELRRFKGAPIIVTSLLTELGVSDEPWPKAVDRLRAAYADLARGGVPVFICTILRHVARTEEPGADAAVRLHIRRLNLLAAEISRETKAYVIDIDRFLADIGARRLRTDYRLAGEAAAEIAGHFIALTLINNAFDDIVSFEIQDAAKMILTSERPTIAGPDGNKPAVTLAKPLLSVGQGRQRQLVVPIFSTVPRDNTGTLIRQVLQGSIKPAAAYRRLVKAVRWHGVRRSAVLIAVGLSKQFNRKR